MPSGFTSGTSALKASPKNLLNSATGQQDIGVVRICGLSRLAVAVTDFEAFCFAIRRRHRLETLESIAENRWDEKAGLRRDAVYAPKLSTCSKHR